MSPEERQLLVDLFDRTRQASSNPRDREAENFISDQVRAQPYAPYLLAQTVIVQDQALRAANERLQQLEQRVREAESHGERQGSGGFLGGLGSLLGGGDRNPPPPSSVPPSRWGGGAPQGGAPGYGQSYGGQQPYPGPAPWWAVGRRRRALPAARRGRRLPQGRSWRGGWCRRRRSDGRFRFAVCFTARETRSVSGRASAAAWAAEWAASAAVTRSSTITTKAATPPRQHAADVLQDQDQDQDDAQDASDFGSGDDYGGGDDSFNV